MILVNDFEIVVIGASFAGAAFVRNLPKSFSGKILVVDVKQAEGLVVETTGLITEKSRQIFENFFDIDKYITNPITDIGVFATNFEDRFFSHEDSPWIYQTDTKKLLQDLRKDLPDNVEVWGGCAYINNSQTEKDGFFEVGLMRNGEKIKVRTRFLVGADGADSRVAKQNNLSQTKEFFFGVESVYFGKVLVGERPQATAYHFWFGEFSLGYGGWISSVKYNGKSAVRIGLAKRLSENKDAKKLLDKFVKKLVENKYVEIFGEVLESYGNRIPASGVLKNIYNERAILIGDAAGFCGAFAADGIKGALISGIGAADLVPRYLENKNVKIFRNLKRNMESEYGSLTYYRKQKFYRFVWNVMRRNDTFDQMFLVIKTEKEFFLRQFCDNHEKNKSLVFVFLSWRNMPNILLYGFYLVRDFFRIF